jgi:hypothetical protein
LGASFGATPLTAATTGRLYVFSIQHIIKTGYRLFWFSYFECYRTNKHLTQSASVCSFTPGLSGTTNQKPDVSSG